MERIGGVHAEWYRRHIAHLAYAMEALEEGDHGVACYHAYQAVSVLLSGIIGLDPYAPGAYVKILSAMLKTAVDHPPADVATCRRVLRLAVFLWRRRRKMRHLRRTPHQHTSRAFTPLKLNSSQKRT
jgi:Uncharacterized conserved protein related to C-terminal domain of eukaryotic chaperone, SACSIN